MNIIKRKEALKLGLKKYYTSNACKSGHVAERSVKSGMCDQCVVEAYKRRKQALIAKHGVKDANDLLRSEWRNKMRRYRDKNRDNSREYMREYMREYRKTESGQANVKQANKNYYAKQKSE